MKQIGLTLIIASALSAGLTNVGHASTKHSSAASLIATNAYDLTLDSTGSPIDSVGTVTITTNSKKDTLTYKFSLTNGGRLTGVYLDADGGTASRDLGSVTNSLGSFTDSFKASGKSFSVTFKGTDLANFTTLNMLNGFTQIFGGVNTTKGLFADATRFVQVNTPTVVPIPGALPLFASGLGAMGLLGWRRKRKVQLATG